MMTKQAELKKQAYASKLKSRALSVLLYLIDRSNKELTCFPAIPTMAEQLHISVSTVKRALHELLESGYIKKDARYREKNKGQTSNLYTLVLFEGGSAPDGDDGLYSKDCAKESGAAEVKQEKEEEAGQETCQVEHISFDILTRQKEKVLEAQIEEAQEKAHTAVREEDCQKNQQESINHRFCTPSQIIKHFSVKGHESNRFSVMHQDGEKCMVANPFGGCCTICLCLWTGAGFSMRPP